jgi:hypothetical protein
LFMKSVNIVKGRMTFEAKMEDTPAKFATLPESLL